MTLESDRAAELITDSVRRSCEGERVAVAFSGGVDSGLVAGLSMRYAESVTLYVAGVPGSHDILAAESAAAEMGADLRVLEVSDPVGLIRDEMEVTGTVNPLVLAFTSPLFKVLSSCSEVIVLAGQGADEVFGGYNKYVSVPDTELKSRMREDTDRFFRETLPHEERIAARFGRDVRRPYFDDELTSYVGSLGPSVIRPSSGDRKRVLCDAARSLGYGFLADRPKKAAQYGSGILDAVKAECRSRGVEYNTLVAEMAGELGLRAF